MLDGLQRVRPGIKEVRPQGQGRGDKVILLRRVQSHVLPILHRPADLRHRAVGGDHAGGRDRLLSVFR